MQKILIVEDDEKLRNELEIYEKQKAHKLAMFIRSIKHSILPAS